MYSGISSRTGAVVCARACSSPRPGRRNMAEAADGGVSKKCVSSVAYLKWFLYFCGQI